MFLLYNQIHHTKVQQHSSNHLPFPISTYLFYTNSLILYPVPEKEVGVYMSLSKAALSIPFKVLFFQLLKTSIFYIFNHSRQQSLPLFKGCAELFPNLEEKISLILLSIFLIPLTRYMQTIHRCHYFLNVLFPRYPLQTPSHSLKRLRSQRVHSCQI